MNLFSSCLFSSSLRHYHYHHHSANENNVFSFIWKSNVIWWLSILFAIVACQFCIQVPLVSRKNKQIAMKAMPKVKLFVMRSIINFLKKLFLDLDKYHCNNVHMRDLWSVTKALIIVQSTSTVCRRRIGKIQIMATISKRKQNICTNSKWNAIDFTRFAPSRNWNDLECFQLLTACVINYTLNCTSKIPNAHTLREGGRDTNYMHSPRIHLHAMQCTSLTSS